VRRSSNSLASRVKSSRKFAKSDPLSRDRAILISLLSGAELQHVPVSAGVQRTFRPRPPMLAVNLSVCAMCGRPAMNRISLAETGSQTANSTG